MAKKEATARLKINKLLEAAGWRFFAEGSEPVTVVVESNSKLTTVEQNDLGEDFEKTKSGYIDFLLLNEKGFPFVVLEAKSEDKDPLVGKEQARTYAKAQNCRQVILSNGNRHYLWDLERGNPEPITAFPTPKSLQGYQKLKPTPDQLISEDVQADYIATTQRPNYQHEAGWIKESERPEYIKKNKLRFMRPYQLQAIKALQEAFKQGKDRFLFEMATGTGKTLTAAAIIKLFLKTGNARRVLFLVDRLELEDQAKKNFDAYLKPDYSTVIYKENKDDWNKAEVVVTTVQSLLHDNKYLRLFSPTDFDLVISDEAHRSIGGNARAVFNYFIGYKLGLTATPKNYLKQFNSEGSRPGELERRQLLDTYRIFGCEDSEPTFRYSLLDGVKEGFLINPIVVDARSEVTTELLSAQGFVANFTDDTGQNVQETYTQRQFEKKFFSDSTNQLFCQAFLEGALRDPISQEIGKSILFTVSQSHAAKLTQVLNIIADKMFPGRYQSDFAVQVTSQIPDAQQFTINFANNKLLGSANFLNSYKTGKARVCVTVGMMTTGYDCEDILNIGLFRPIFSPSEFIQIKGRGTRKHDFRENLFDDSITDLISSPNKTAFKLFDFFANCEYFENEFNYDETLKLPKPKSATLPRDENYTPPSTGAVYEHDGVDALATVKEQPVGFQGMRIDRMYFQTFEDSVRDDPRIAQAVEAGRWDEVIKYVNTEVFDKPKEYFSLEKLRKAADVDRKLELREILEKVFGLIPSFKSKDQLLEEEFAKFIADQNPSPETYQSIPAIKTYFKAYVTDDRLRKILESKEFAQLSTNPSFTTKDYRSVPAEFRALVPAYVKDYVPISQFGA